MSLVEMRVIDTSQLIEEVKSRPALWDKNEDLYKKSKLKHKYWLEITKRLTPDFGEMNDKQRKNAIEKVIQKWKCTRDMYVRHKNSLKLPRLDGSQRTYIYSKEMEFLDPVMGFKEWKRKRKIVVEPPKKPIEEPPKAPTEDEDTLFFRSMLPRVKKIPPEKKLVFQMEMLQLLLKYQPNPDGCELITDYQPPSTPVDKPKDSDLAELDDKFEATEDFLLKKERLTSDDDSDSEL